MIALRAVEKGVVGAEAAAAIYSCLLCRACTVKCPISIRVADVVREVRSLIARGKLKVLGSPRVEVLG
jgi:Fe-S oxidoreductase